ncbi:MAG: hypothetical protein ACREEK_12625 [Bradyrhizobium sp.]
MQDIYRRLSARLSEEDRRTVATWRKRVIAFYGVLCIATALFVLGAGSDKRTADNSSLFSGMTASSKE